MTPRIICKAPNPRTFAPYGTFVTPPADFGERSFFSEHLGGGGLSAEPVFHVNRVRPVTLPTEIVEVERHPRADQVFLPLDVAQYLAVVMPSDGVGNPLVDRAIAFVVPGNMGVIYHANVWHAGAAVLDRPGNFAVLMWRSGDDADDEFRKVPRFVVEAAPGRHDLMHMKLKDRR